MAPNNIDQKMRRGNQLLLLIISYYYCQRTSKHNTEQDHTKKTKQEQDRARTTPSKNNTEQEQHRTRPSKNNTEQDTSVAILARKKKRPRPQLTPRKHFLIVQWWRRLLTLLRSSRPHSVQ